MHWLPVYFRIKYKIATLTYNVVTLNQLLYLAHLLVPYTPGRSLRSHINTGADLGGGVTRVTSHPHGAEAYFMLLLCVKALLIMPTS